MRANGKAARGPRFCPTCGARAPEGDFSFCPACGAALPEAAIAAAAPDAPQEAAPPQESGAGEKRGRHAKPEAERRGRDGAPSPARLTKRERKEKRRQLERLRKEQRAELKKTRKSLKRRLASSDTELSERFEAARKRRRKAGDVYSTIGFDLMFCDGTAQVEDGLFSQTIAFSDISYQSSRVEDQRAYFDLYCQVFDYCGSETSLQLSVINTPLPRSEVGHRLFFDEDDPATNALAREYNRVLNDKMREGFSNLERERYLTFSVGADTYDEALPKLARLRGDLSQAFAKLGCAVRRLDGFERAEVLSSQLRPGADFELCAEDLIASGLKVKDFVVPAGIDFRPDGDSTRFAMSGKHCQVLAIRSFGSRLADQALSDIIDLNIPLNVSLHTQAIDKGKSTDYVKRQLMWIDKDIIDQQQKAVRKGYDGSLIPQELAYSKNEAEELLEELQYKSQRLFLFTGAVYTWADSVEELQENVVQIIRTARRNSIEIDVLDCQQKPALNTVLPLGHCHLAHSRYLTTAQVGMMLPFATQEINHAGGGYYGQNKVSKNLILLDRATLPSGGHGWVLGQSGSGKSFFVKREITNNFLAHPDDEFIIIDPQQEYPPLVEGLGGSVVRLSPSSRDHINVFDVYSNAAAVTGDDPLDFKGETVLALADAMLGGGAENKLSAEEKSLIDRCVRLTYARFAAGPTPTLGDFYQVLCEQPDAEARRLRLSFEMYVSGGLAYFNAPTTVSLDSRITAFSFKQLGANMRLFAMLIILDWVYSRMLYNFERGVKTWLYIDEVQTLFSNTAVVSWFDTFYSTGRKYNLCVTSITQTVERIVDHDVARYLLANADFLALLKQSDRDRKALTEILGLSDQQSGYIARDINPGEGLLIAGGAVVPFEDDFPRGRLYDLWNTKPDEIAERKKAQWESMPDTGARG